MIGQLEEFTLAVLGPRLISTSAFIQAVLDLDSSSTSPFPVKRALLDNFACLLRFIEVSLADMRVTSEHPIEWPTYVHQIKSKIDGAFFLWDATKKDPQEDDILGTLSKCGEAIFHMNLTFKWFQPAQS